MIMETTPACGALRGTNNRPANPSRRPQVREREDVLALGGSVFAGTRAGQQNHLLLHCTWQVRLIIRTHGARPWHKVHID
jgi:hypothetical protein